MVDRPARHCLPRVTQALIFGCGSLAASTPVLAALLFVIILAWIRSARSLNGMFQEAMAAEAA